MIQQVYDPVLRQNLQLLADRIVQGEPIRRAVPKVFPGSLGAYYKQTTPELRQYMISLKPDQKCNPCVFTSMEARIEIRVPPDRKKAFEKYCTAKGVDMSRMLNSLMIRAMAEVV